MLRLSFRPFRPALAAAAVGLIAPIALAQPANDRCQNAIVLVANVVRTGNSFGATSDLTGSGCSLADSADVWYAFTAGAAGFHQVDTLGSLFDTTLAAYTACGGAQLACNDDEPGGDTSSLIGLEMTAGQSIRLRVAGFLAEEGGFNIFVTAPTAPVTGACCRGVTCGLALAAGCTGTNTAYKGDGTACNAAGNFTTPCCKSDFNQSGGTPGTTIQDVFDFLGAYFVQDPLADFNGLSGVSVQDVFDFLGAYFAQAC
jgi:hypothetical protein